MKRYQDIIAAASKPYPYMEEAMRLYAASIAAGCNGQLTIGTKFILARDDEEAKELAEKQCFDEFRVSNGYKDHIAIVQPIREGCYRGSDGNTYNIIVETA